VATSQKSLKLNRSIRPLHGGGLIGPIALSELRGDLQKALRGLAP